MLKHFAVCLAHVKTFLESKGLSYAQPEDHDWPVKLDFMVDMTSHLNTLNKSLQGKGSSALQMLDDVLAFERKMTAFNTDVQRGTRSYFPSLREFKEEHNFSCDHRNANCIWGKIQQVQKGEKNTLSFPVTPWDIGASLWNMSAFNTSQPDVEIELTDIADKGSLLSKFKHQTDDLEDVKITTTQME